MSELIREHGSWLKLSIPPRGTAPEVSEIAIAPNGDLWEPGDRYISFHMDLTPSTSLYRYPDPYDENPWASVVTALTVDEAEALVSMLQWAIASHRNDAGS